MLARSADLGTTQRLRSERRYAATALERATGGNLGAVHPNGASDKQHDGMYRAGGAELGE